MTKTRILVFAFAVSLFSFLPCFAQRKAKEEPLITFLKKIEHTFKCNFSYINNELESVFLKNPILLTKLKKNIQFLEANTNFKFTFIGEKSITISLKAKKSTLCATLISSYNKEVIPNATISNSSSEILNTKSGAFTLDSNQANENIRIEAPGFEPLVIKASKLNKSPCTLLELIPKTENLKEIYIQNYLTRGIYKNTDGSTKINYKNFGILPGLMEPDLLQTLQALPGILSVDESISSINVRGGTHDQNLILWDGIKMYQSSHFFGLISAFNPYLTENVTLFKNGTSAQYGDGVSSVISMNTSDTLTKDNEASIGLNMLSIDGYVNTKISKKSSIQFTARTAITDVLESITYQNYYDKAFQNSEVLAGTDQEFSFSDTSVRWLYEITPKDRLKINGLMMRNKLVFQENEIDSSNLSSRESSLEQQNLAGGISYLRNWSSHFKTNMLLYGSNYKIESINSDIVNNQRLLQENEVLEGGVKLNSEFKWNDQISLSSGYQYNETGIEDLRDVNNPLFRDFKKEVIRTHSIYSELKVHPKRTHIALGLRSNYFSKFNSFTFEPRIHIHHKIFDTFTIELQGELKSQVTSQIINFQNDFLGVENRKWVLSNNTTVPIIKSQQLSLGLHYNFNNLMLHTYLYYKNVDGIFSLSQGFQNQFEFLEDQGSYSVSGIECLLSKKWNFFRTWLSYTISKNEYEFNTFANEPFPNTIDIRHNLSIAMAYVFNRFKISAGINWHSGSPATGITNESPTPQGTISYGAPNAITLKDYFRIDASASYNFSFSKRLKGYLGLSLWNITQYENIVSNYYFINVENQIQEVRRKGLKFTPNFVFRIKF